MQIQLLPTPEQAEALRQTVETVNCAANRLSDLAWEAKEFRQFPMHKLFYRQIRLEYPLSSQIVVRLNAKVADAYKRDCKTKRCFRKHGGISYDCRILDFQLPESTVSIWAIGGRIKELSFVCGERQRKLLRFPKGESDLIYRQNKWYLNVVVDVPEENEQQAIGWIGIDLGLVNIAQDSDGRTYGHARKIRAIRNRRHRQRARLQRKGTRSARRVLRRLSGRESRFIGQMNHLISKQICAEAKRTKRGIALENLKHIRSRVRARKSQQRSLHSWTFADLRSKIAYKCKLVGVPVKFVDPRNTSRECAACGNTNKKNRTTRDSFTCKECGHAAPADTNAARVIAGRALVIAPHERNGVRVHVQDQPRMVG